MENYVIATNVDNRVEAFYIEKSTVMHTWQLDTDNPTLWSAPNTLTASRGDNQSPLTNALRVEATTNSNGQIHVVAYTTDGKYYTCYQTPGAWNGWAEIIQK
jgi:hypothetical protein